MGLYNVVRGRMLCPRCNQLCDVDVETRLGDMHQLAELQIGDRYPWLADKPATAGGRPDHGDAIGDGYCVCPLCEKDFFVRVVVEADVIHRLDVDHSRAGFIRDA